MKVSMVSLLENLSLLFSISQKYLYEYALYKARMLEIPRSQPRESNSSQMESQDHRDKTGGQAFALTFAVAAVTWLQSRAIQMVF